MERERKRWGKEEKGLDREGSRRREQTDFLGFTFGNSWLLNKAISFSFLFQLGEIQ